MPFFTDSTPTAKDRYISLKWKIGVVIGLVLIIVNAAITWVAYRQSNQQFSAEKLALLQQQQRMISGLLQRDYDQLNSFGSFIPLLSGGAPKAGSAGSLAAILDRHSAMLGLEWGIESLSFVDPRGRISYSWSGRKDRSSHSELAKQAQLADAPAGRIQCRQTCVLTLALPQLDGPLRGGVLVISRSIADGILEFNRLSSSEVAVLVAQPEPPKGGADGGDDRYLSGWQVKVPALSHPDRSLPLLRKLEQLHALADLRDGMVLVESDGEWYACLLGQDAAAGEDVSFMVMTPVSEGLAQLAQANRLLLAAGLLGLLATGVVLLWFLWKPMNRIHQIVRALPALGQSDFDKMRAALPLGKGSVFKDEIDVVVDSVRQLSDDLEQALDARGEAEQNLVWLADHDPLTNLFNRRRFQEVFDRILAVSVRYQRPGALLFLDLDQFKVVNDLSGHQAGDALLLLVASTLKDAIRHSDILARLGGDEFALVLPEAGGEEAVYMANKLQHDLQQVDFSSSGRLHRVSCSIGITLFPGHGGVSTDLLANADMAMYQAKEAGGARWHMYAPDELAKELLASRARWRERIDQALLDDTFELHFQPIYDIRAARITRYETLVRMRDNSGELVFPDHFIPVAEQSGQILEIDRWVIRKAIEHVQRQPALLLAVNLSGRVLDDPSLLAWFHTQLQSSAIDPSHLIVEITETAAVANVQDAIVFMREIKALGCRFALDDFGSGFSSFAYLKQLPVDIVKIDGSFIRNLANSEQDQLFVKALTDVAKGLGKQTVAEFVEDEETLHLLRTIGVDFAQGYHIGPPAPAKRR